MRIIFDIPGQTCNRLWSYITCISESLANNEKVVILFFDHTLFHFPHFNNNHNIYFPFRNKSLIKLFGYKRYMKFFYFLFANRFINHLYKTKFCNKIGFTEGVISTFEPTKIRRVKPTLFGIVKPTF